MVKNLQKWLLGEWSTIKLINDLLKHENGVFIGKACFTRESSMRFDYYERGSIKFDKYNGIATQKYSYKFIDDNTANIYNMNQQFFHTLNLSDKVWNVSYHCNNDCYQGYFVVKAADMWIVDWNISGPKKKLLISCIYNRLL